MALYYDNLYEIEFAKEVQTQLELIKRSKQRLSKNNSICYEILALFREGFMNRKTMYSTLAIMTFVVFPSVSGTVFSDNYTVQVFDQLKDNELGESTTFYSGFVVLFASILSLSW